MFDIARSLLFQLPPETAHDVTLKALAVAPKWGLTKWLPKPPENTRVRVMGLDFPNPVGLAAGLDKNGIAIDGMGALGFGFVEVGTVTPKPQPGNPRPRLFRLPAQQAIINRMGFNNDGLEHLIENVRRRQWPGILGINVGKNKVTPPEQTADDYCQGIAAAYPWASYITVNVSSPNTPGLRDLQFGDALKDLLKAVKAQQQREADKHGHYVPIAVKIAPDMDEQALRFVADALVEAGMDGVIATNTTLSRVGVEGARHSEEQGGLSGAPLMRPSTEILRKLADNLQGELPIIGVGGITRGNDAVEKLRAGASLVQIYSGFIYRGPRLIHECVRSVDAAHRAGLFELARK
ncbi:quinone-dependent dihydroorotate dehydrogenase [Marinobacteraceae bacterium S3BR75-40.1]